MADQLTMLPAVVLGQIVRHLDDESLTNLNRASGLLSFSIYRAVHLADSTPGPPVYGSPIEHYILGSPYAGQIGPDPFPDSSHESPSSTRAPAPLVGRTPPTPLLSSGYQSPTNARGLTPQSPSTSLPNSSHQSPTSTRDLTPHTTLTPSTSPPSSTPKHADAEIEWTALMNMSTSEESTSEKTPPPTMLPNGPPSLLSLALPPSIEAALAELEQLSQGMDISEDDKIMEQKEKSAVEAPPSGEEGSETARRGRGRGRGRGRPRGSRGRGSGKVRGESSTRGGEAEPSRGHRHRDTSYWRTALGPGMSRRTRSSENQ